MTEKDIELCLDGIGIAIYSDGCMNGIAEGSDFFNAELADPKKAAGHIRKGDISCFCTGSGGDYTLKIRQGYPDAETYSSYPVSISLGLEVKGGKVSFIDIYWLMEWSGNVPEDQQIELEDGFYHLTVLTRLPESGYWGGDQTIYIYFNKLDAMPQLTWQGVPQLFTD
ncbi:MAG: hypothetical protein IJ779_11755 [Ruminococcus sp.]|nr:hypothetical protein [Ruminococcus sp.]